MNKSFDDAVAAASKRIKEFWDGMAEEHQESPHATAPDHYYREIEIRNVVFWLNDKKDSHILDVGCGNGYSTLRYAEARTFPKFLGLDYSDEMIEQAQKKKHPNIEWAVGDVSKPLLLDRRYDHIISTRCLINLESWEEQQRAILNLSRHLAPFGTIILVENCIEGLENLNTLRALVGLPPIEQRWHNRYFSYDELIVFLYEHFHVIHKNNIGNLYYIISRVVYAKIAQIEGFEPVYDNRMNEIAAQLPSLGYYDYSPNWIFVLRAKR